jgi:RNA polymerase-binding transcription factor DksA
VNPLTDEQMAELGRRLQAHAAELRDEVGTLDDEAGDASAQAALSTTGAPNDPADEADRGEQATRTAVRHAEKERDQLELRQIADARERMRTGDYGQCIDCGTDIALERLQALPSAERCMPCQERHERDHPVGVRIPLTS